MCSHLKGLEEVSLVGEVFLQLGMGGSKMVLSCLGEAVWLSKRGTLKLLQLIFTVDQLFSEAGQGVPQFLYLQHTNTITTNTNMKYRD